MTATQLLDPSERRIPAQMSDPTPARKPRPDAANSAGSRPAGRELVGRRGSAPIERSRAAANHLVSGKSTESMRRRADDRQRILETDLTPWRMICALSLRSPSGAEAVSTGWLAGPRTIITAGQTVHCHGFHGGWAGSIEVSAGRNRSSRPYSQLTATRFAATDRWVTHADPGFNFGCIQLDLPLGDLTGWFGLASLTPSELESALVNIGGYPADRGSGIEQYCQPNRILQAGDRCVSFDIETASAPSGAPVWIHRTPSAPPVVVALQADGTGGGTADPGITANSALRITPEIFDMINTWIRDDIAVAA